MQVVNFLILAVISVLLGGVYLVFSSTSLPKQSVQPEALHAKVTQPALQAYGLAEVR